MNFITILFNYYFITRPFSQASAFSYMEEDNKPTIRRKIKGDSGRTSHRDPQVKHTMRLSHIKSRESQQIARNARGTFLLTYVRLLKLSIYLSYSRLAFQTARTIIEITPSCALH